VNIPFAEDSLKPLGQLTILKVENPGNDPGYPDFQSGAYTMFANPPCKPGRFVNFLKVDKSFHPVEIKGLEPLTGAV
jgi:hypothetical protein